MAACAEHEPVHWVQRHEAEFLVSIQPNGFENFFNNFGVMEKSWSTIEGVSVFLEQASAPADSFGFLEDGDIYA
jgi:hypothetical protein